MKMRGGRLEGCGQSHGTLWGRLGAGEVSKDPPPERAGVAPPLADPLIQASLPPELENEFSRFHLFIFLIKDNCITEFAKNFVKPQHESV